MDLIKTNMYAAGDCGVFEITHKIVDKEGVQGLLRGWSAAYVRLGRIRTIDVFIPNVCLIFQDRKLL